MSLGRSIEENKILAEFKKDISLIVPDLEAPDLPETKQVVRFKEHKGTAITEQNSLDDFEFARNTIHHLIENGQIALAELLRVAMISDHPRAFEVVSTLMKNIGDMTKDMLSLQEKMLDMQTKMRDLSVAPVDNKDEDGVFYGTPEELLEKLENERKHNT